MLTKKQNMTTLTGKVSWFGGPEDTGVSPSEGLAFIYEVRDAPWLFLPEQPPGTSGLARRLDPSIHYIACRWDYNQTPKSMLPGMVVQVRSTRTGQMFKAFPADWGPHVEIDRVADISPGLMEALGIQTDDEVEVYFPYHEAIEEIPMPYPAIVISSGHGKSSVEPAAFLMRSMRPGRWSSDWPTSWGPEGLRLQPSMMTPAIARTRTSIP